MLAKLVSIVRSSAQVFLYCSGCLRSHGIGVLFADLRRGLKILYSIAKVAARTRASHTSIYAHKHFRVLGLWR
jgi:hypothetical protein